MKFLSNLNFVKISIFLSLLFVIYYLYINTKIKGDLNGIKLLNEISKNFKSQNQDKNLSIDSVSIASQIIKKIILPEIKIEKISTNPDINAALISTTTKIVNKSHQNIITSNNLIDTKSILNVLSLSTFLTPITSSKSEIKTEYKKTEKNDNLLCIVMTSSKTIEERCVAVWETWASQCNHTIFACNCKNATFKTSKAEILFKNLTFLELPIEENYNLMAKKVMMIIQLSFAKYGNLFNWFLLTDDDTFIFTKNAFKFMSTHSDSDALTYGYNFKTIVKGGYHSGGGSVLFPHKSMSLIYQSIINKKCNFIDGYGDVALGECAQIANVKLGNSLDSFGRERFHCLDPYSHYYKNIPDWLYAYALNPIKAGIECCSNETISFHYVGVRQMYLLKRIKDIEEIKSI